MDKNITDIENTGERMIPEYSGMNTFWEHIYRYRFTLPYVKSKRVLDIACGEGYGTSAIQMAGAKKTLGIDISHLACNHAHTKYGIDYLVGSAEEIPLDNESVDVVISFETIEHLDNPMMLLKATQRVLSKEGILIISTPNKEIYSLRGKNDFHKTEFTKIEFLRSLENYYSSIKLFGQIPISGHIYSRNAFSSNKIPMSDLPGFCVMDVLREKILEGFYGEPLEKRLHADETILEKENIFSKLLNPYYVRPILGPNDIFTYLIAIASNIDQ